MIRINDKLSKILGDNTADSRRDNWLWLYLSDIRAARYNVMALDQRTMRDTIANTISSAKLNIQIILSHARRRIISENLMTWVTENERQHEWIKSKLFIKHNYSYLTPENLKGREQILALIDIWDIDLKQSTIESLKRDWIEQLKKDKQLDWIKEEDELEACTYIWDWMLKNKRNLTGGYTQPMNHQSALVFFDSIHMTELEKKLCISSAKKIWRQKISRNTRKDRNQKNFNLTEKAIRRLEEFSKRYELSQTQIIEILLMMEQEKGLYIAERIRILRGIES
ncbi:hypothetical protein OFL75_26625 [Pseudomonas aeruginosa]|uniref:hypothetical protein n=1 Tax=Pseudomonas aeruginosa TaxID=287 RepID=UPI000F521D71|nr:hypothetical protein [Pseudomonas aeruginosa]EKW2385203.1 hypothetical protein [Pseudomonas aeruginosa]MBD1298854.1 hypothetical protein [Pseudomonas aeruginosa]MBD1338993.1 hypothetical protein [Pseudomonas aeruginosa]MBV5797191.1 hypothetical protein [Pseudomonas aeruginosa]MBW6275149.1 hypothetical protein [Pseudomonas aeruginosa]